MERIGASPEFAATAVFPLETALASVALLAAGITERFPRLRILLSHGGGALSWILPRMDFGWSLGLKGQMTQPPSKIARQLWYDTILYDPASLSFSRQCGRYRSHRCRIRLSLCDRQKQPGLLRRARWVTSRSADNAFAFLGRMHDVKKLDRAAAPNSVSGQGSRARG